jgi:hypothetical protein
MKLILNGAIVPPSEYTGNKGLSIELSEVDGDGRLNKATSQQFNFTGAAFDLIYAELIQDPNGKNKFLSVKIYEDTCCLPFEILLFEGIVRGDSVDWCYGDCHCTVTFTEQTAETEIVNCIKSTPIDDNWNGFQSANHPRVPYCVELRPDFLQYVMLSFANALNLVLRLLQTIVFIFQIVINTINFIIVAINFLIPGTDHDIDPLGPNAENGDPDWDGYLQNFRDWVDRINQKIIGCGRKHPSPFVRDYIKNVCSKCGLTFQSTILNNPNSQYYQSIYLNAPVEKGTYNNGLKWIVENRPIKSLTDFLDDFKTLFNGDYEINNGVLTFERKDFFYTGEIFVNYLLLLNSNRIATKLCLKWRTEPRPAYAEFVYGQDAVDIVGNEALRRYNSGPISWNTPYSPLQSGKYQLDVPFGVARFRDDQIDTDILGQTVTTIINGASLLMVQTVQNHHSVLILSHGTCTLPKLLIWDEVNINFVRTRKYSVPNYNQNTPVYINGLGTISIINDDRYGYNFPYFFNPVNTAFYPAGPNNPDAGYMGLYGRFHDIDNPQRISDHGLEFSFTMYYNCESLQASLTAKHVQLPMGVGRINKMTVNLDDKSITISGDV